MIWVTRRVFVVFGFVEDFMGKGFKPYNIYVEVAT